MERVRNLTFPVVAIIVVFGSLLGTVAVQILIVQNRVDLDRVSAEISQERERNQQLNLQVIELESPERILESAIGDLGMIRPGQRTYLPGVDPDDGAIAQPSATGDPFGPAPLSEALIERFAGRLEAAGFDVGGDLGGDGS